ncbi:hypothetical protein ACFFKU_17795 [Kineococcus gynurae]|uniref:Signal transduction histidine kinase n=1 Tax=Kineococcus gynurae TaxID=452979 RepID=A0ABV5LNK6_9ACTN
MTPLQRACLVGAGLWLFSHAVLVTLLGLGATTQPVLMSLTCLLVVGTSAYLLRPLLGRPLALGRRAAWAAAAVVPLSGLLVMPFLEPESWRTYPNWWPGAGQIIVVALVLRHRRLPAVAAVLASAGVITAGVLTAEDLPWSRGGTIAALNQPALLWLSASLAARHLFDATARTLARYSSEVESVAAERAATAARAVSDRSRRTDLEQTVVPLLSTVARTAPDDDAAWDTAARAARTLERQLRDDLRARALVDTRVRDALRVARARGIEVDVVDDRRTGSDPGELLAAGRGTLVVVLVHAARCRVTTRLPPSGTPLTIAVEGEPEVVDAVAAAVERSREFVLPRSGALRMTLDLHPGSLWVELHPA